MSRHTILRAASLIGLLVTSPVSTYAQSITAGGVMYIVPGETQTACDDALPLAVGAAGESISAYVDGSRAIRVNRPGFSILLSCYYYELRDIVIVRANVAGATREDMLQAADVAEKVLAALDDQRPW